MKITKSHVKVWQKLFKATERRSKWSRDIVDGLEDAGIDFVDLQAYLGMLRTKEKLTKTELECFKIYTSLSKQETNARFEDMMENHQGIKAALEFENGYTNKAEVKVDGNLTLSEVLKEIEAGK